MSDTTRVLPGLFARDVGSTFMDMVMASAAAVPSSSKLAFEMGKAVRSQTMVWKLSNDSSRPWLISGWYGV